MPIQTCVHCGTVNPDENGYCTSCHGLLEASPTAPQGPLGTYHPYVMWDRWPWATFQTVTQSWDQFVTSMVVQALGLVFALIAAGIALGVQFGPLAAAVGVSLLSALAIGLTFTRWRTGRRRAMWYARDHP